VEGFRRSVLFPLRGAFPPLVFRGMTDDDDDEEVGSSDAAAGGGFDGCDMALGMDEDPFVNNVIGSISSNEPSVDFSNG